MKKIKKIEKRFWYTKTFFISHFAYTYEMKNMLKNKKKLIKREEWNTSEYNEQKSKYL